MTWKEIIDAELEMNNESFDDIIFYTVDNWPNMTRLDWMNLSVKNCMEEGFNYEFQAWTKDFIYFSDEYGGELYVDSIQRNPPKND